MTDQSNTPAPKVKAPKVVKAKKNPARLDVHKLKDLIDDIEAHNHAHLRLGLINRLVVEQGAKISTNSAGISRVVLGGISVTTTTGEHLSLVNWCNKARRAIRAGGGV